MLNEFYNYIASNIISFFQSKIEILRAGERYCLRLENVEMVEGIDCALRNQTKKDHIQGTFEYGDVYSTFTIRISPIMEVVVASKIDGMTDEFLATLRNAELTENHFPILMITHSAIDTITSGTGDLSANGMPFHSLSIVEKIKRDIQDAQFSLADRILLETELERKQSDRFSDKSSLFEYAELLSILERGYVRESDYPTLSLLPDPDGKLLEEEKKIRARLDENHKLFRQIDFVFKYGNTDSLEKVFDKNFIDHLDTCKKKNLPWYENYTYVMIKSSQDKLKKKLDNPLQIEDIDFECYCGSPIEYSFIRDKTFFMRDDGESKVKKRRKNILIYNPDRKDEITISITTNISIKQGWVEKYGCEVTTTGKEIKIFIRPEGCTFAYVKINDINNNIAYILKVCVIDIVPKYLEEIQTVYMLNVPKRIEKSTIQIFGIEKKLIVNPGYEDVVNVVAINDGKYSCNYNQTLELSIDEEAIDTDTGRLDCLFKFGSIFVPIQIQDDPVKPVEITGVGVFKWKYSEKRCLEYRDGKIIAGTVEYFTKEPFRSTLNLENLFVKNGWAAIVDSIDGQKKYTLDLSVDIREAYNHLIDVFNKRRTLPSLAYYESDLFDAAVKYVETVEKEFRQINAGDTLKAQINDMLLLGCVIKNVDEYAIAMSPLHPLNVMYQLHLLPEQNVGNIRDLLVEKLTALYLLPYIKDPNRNLYHAIEQRYAPEWRYYAPISNKRYQGARNFVPKLVCDKIIQYKEHFSFLFDDIGNSQLQINLVNMGDCKEVFQGLLRFYVQSLKNNAEPEKLLSFVINIYSEQSGYNEFLLLSDQRKLKEYIRNIYSGEDIGELFLLVTGKIRCFFRNLNDLEYQYAHLTFYEMASSEDTGASRMDSITTGIALGGLTSGTPSVLNAGWYKTGFGTKYVRKNQLTQLASYYNALYRVSYSGSSYEPNSSIFTEIEQGQEGILGKIYTSSNWVVFVDPKVDLSFFQKGTIEDNELMIIHYSDQYTSASGYDDITVTQKSEQYNEIISEQLQKKGVLADSKNINEIISLFNAVNGGWMLRLITVKKLAGAADSFFSREKMSILSAIKLCMAYYTHPNIVWIPISLEEMLRVSGGAGLSQKEGLLSAKNLGFEQRATSDDILLVGVEGPEEHIKIYLHPVEVKIGQNPSAVLNKARAQVLNTYQGFWNALWPENGRNDLERKLSRNFFVQLILVSCEKFKLYNIYPDENWDDVLCSYRKNLLNEQYEISDNLDQYLGKGTVVSFGTEVLNMAGRIDEDVCLLEFPEKMGSSYMVMSAKQIENELDFADTELPARIKDIYGQDASLENRLALRSLDHQDQVQDQNYLKNTLLVESKTKCCVNDGFVNQEEYFVESTSDEKIKEEVPELDERQGMQILFGTDVVTGDNLYWYPNDTNQLFHTNTGIIGTMGTGKTQFTKSIITQLYRDQKYNFGREPLGILIFDYKGDYNESKEDFVKATNAKILKPYHLPFNPLALTKSKVFKPLLPIHTANAFKDTLSKIYGLGPKQQNLLFQCILDAYAAKGIVAGDPASWENMSPTFDMVYKLYSDDETIKKNDSLAAAMDKLYQFQVFEGNPDETESLFELLNGVVVIDLSGYDTDIQSLIVAITLDLFYAQMQAAGSSKLDQQYRQLTKLILVDEADNFMSEGFPALKKILKEGREFGVGTILSTQFLKHFGNGEDDYSKYILTWVVHNVADLKSIDVEFVFKAEAKSTECLTVYNDIKALEKHHSIVKISSSKPRYIRDKAFWELYNELND